MKDKTAYWVWLSSALGPCSAKLSELLREFDYVEDIYAARSSAGLSALLNPAEFKAAREGGLEDARATIESCASAGVRVVCYNDSEYPERLRQTRYPPTVLYVSGDVNALNSDCVAGVGARSSTKYGRDAVKSVCEPLARAGLTLVSGLAHGIDAEVHRVSLESGARTIAVLGTAIDDTYPRDHSRLRAEIERGGGAVVSEYPPGTRWNRGLFPMRNRIISGLSRAVIVIEAAKKSGTMITAGWALDDGRDVLAVPGSIFALNCEGTNRLIKQGAYPVTRADDVFAVLGIDPPRDKTAAAEDESADISPRGKEILAALRDGELGLDELALKTSLAPAELLAELTELEITGAVTALPGPKYSV